MNVQLMEDMNTSESSDGCLKRRADELHVSRGTKRIHNAMRRRMQKLDKRRWHEFCSASSLHICPKNLEVIRDSSGPVTRSYHFVLAWQPGKSQR